MPLFSVVIVTHNRMALLPRALDSVRRQSFRDYELIVVDDGSNDGTQDMLKERYAEAKVIRLAVNGGIPVARNAGLAVARGDLVAFLDSDDEWHASYLEHHAGTHRRHPSLLFSFTDYINRGERYSGPVTQVENVPKAPDLVAHMMLRPFIHTMSCFVVPCRTAIECGGFDVRLRRFSDIEFYTRVLAGPDWKTRLACVHRHVAYHRRPQVTRHAYALAPGEADEGRPGTAGSAKANDRQYYRNLLIETFFTSELGQRYAHLRPDCVAGLERGQEDFLREPREAG